MKSTIPKHTKSGNGVQIVGRSLTEDDLGGHLVLGGVGDGVGLASLNTRLRVVIDGELGHGTSEEGSARKNSSEETHVVVRLVD